MNQEEEENYELLERIFNKWYRQYRLNDSFIINKKLFKKHPGLTCYGCKYNQPNLWDCKKGMQKKSTIRPCILYKKT